MEADRFFGPLAAELAWWDCLRAGLHTLVIGCLGWWLLRGELSRRAALLVLLTAMDLAMAQSWQTPTAPVAMWQQPSSMAVAIGDAAGMEQRRVYRSRSAELLPPSWAELSSPQRLVEGMQWERDTLHPKHNLTEGIGSIYVSTAMVSYDHAAWIALAEAEAEQQHSLPRFEQLGATHLILPTNEPLLPAGEAMPLAAYPNVSLHEITSPLPRTRLTRRIKLLPELVDRSAGSIKQRTAEVMQLVADGDTAVVETNRNDIQEQLAAIAAAEIGPQEYARIVTEEANGLVIDVQLQSPALLILADTFTTDWQATELYGGEDPQSLSLLRTNRLFRGVLLPAGSYQVSMHYAPASLWWGALLSGLCWLGMAIVGAVWCVQPIKLASPAKH